MRYAIMLDFGSTYTKIVCVDLKQRRTVVTDKVPSTVHEDASIGMRQCLKSAARAIGETETDNAMKFATSSAAGGLRIAVSGLTASLSNAAGRAAAFSAGGKLVTSSAGILTEEDINQMRAASAEIVLLCGGYERGNHEGVLRNAKILSQSDLRTPVIYAGNSQIAQQVRSLFISRGMECFLAENIIPEVRKLNVTPTTDIIRELFMNRITNMKGVGGISRFLDGPIMPTPQAVLKAGELLSQGTDDAQGIGNFMMVDLGGATTDVYSFNQNHPFEGARQIGLEEPFAKRTVEGDLGMRESAGTLVREVGLDAFAAACGITETEAEVTVKLRDENRAYLADNDRERRIDQVIASSAVRLSARRHVGTVEKGFLQGVQLLQRGKNLTEVTRVIGTGGIIVNAEDPCVLLREVTIDKAECSRKSQRVLLPEEVEILVDRDYVMYAAGLLAEHDPGAALAIMRQSIGLNC